MSHLFSRARSLFGYSDLDGSSSVAMSSVSADLNSEAGNAGSGSANAKMRRKKRNVVIGASLFGVAAITILALTVKHRHSVESAVKVIRNIIGWKCGAFKEMKTKRANIDAVAERRQKKRRRATSVAEMANTLAHQTWRARNHASNSIRSHTCGQAPFFQGADSSG